jgi:putative Mn2+ efflux pump MntP
MAVTNRQALVNTGFLWMAFGAIIYIIGLLWQNVSNARPDTMQIFVYGLAIFIFIGLYYLAQAFVTKDKGD